MSASQGTASVPFLWTGSSLHYASFKVLGLSGGTLETVSLCSATFSERVLVTPSTKADAGCFIVMVIILCSRRGIHFLSFNVVNGTLFWNGESRFYRNANVKRGCREF